jgi:capsid assembly protease
VTAFDLACGIPWAIARDALEGILAIAERAHGVESEAEFEALAARVGKPLENARRVDVRDGVATIEVNGPIFRKANLFTRISGATSMDVLARDFTEAMGAPGIRSVLFSIDSPGGEAHGTHELAALVRAARGKKPVVAHVWGSGASGAYWIASAADAVTANPTALLGSIGVIATLRNRKDPRDLHFVSSVSPHKRADLDTDQGKAQIQATVDHLGEVFVEEVAAHRGVTVAKVRKDFGRGGTLVGRRAVDAGLADGLATYEEVHARLAAGKSPVRAADPYRRFVDDLQGAGR